MFMWYIILILLIVSTGICLIYLSSRLTKFGIINKLARSSVKRCKLLSLTIVIFVFAAIAATINLMNAVVCLLHFSVLWLLSDLLFAAIQCVRKKTFKHYYAGWTAVIATLAALATGWYLNHHVWMTVYDITTEKNIKRLRIAMFADSHIGTTFSGAGFAHHIKKIQQQKPDIVLVAGDFVDDGTTRQEMEEACRILGSLQAPYGIYFAFGNHDKGYHNPAIRGFTAQELITELQKNNVRILQDETELINNAFYIIGRKDSSEVLRGDSRVNMKELVSELDKNKFIIVIDHQPNDYQNQIAAEPDLVLSGHTHGGQLWPLNKVGEWIGANDKTYGLEKRNKTNFIVTSGLSDWAIKFKTGTKSEFVVIDITPQKTAAEI